MSKQVLKKHDGKVPKTFDELEKLPGVGHKTASVVMAQGSDIALQLIHIFIDLPKMKRKWKNVVQTEKDLKTNISKKTWSKLHLQIIFMAENIVKPENAMV